MITTSKEMLDLLKDFFNSPSVDSIQKYSLWSVLSAFRGPDNEDHRLKESITCPIREKVLGSNSDLKCHIDIYPDDVGSAIFRNDLNDEISEHFICHGRQAFQVLGLKWNDVNV